MNFLGNIVFLNPWILAGLAALPVLWYLLRITPPAPKFIALPTTRFLKDLIPENRTSSHTPWWILLLRLLVAALVIIALAGPVYNPAAKLAGTGPVRLVIDNGWAAAQTWDEQRAAASDTAEQAGRDKREIYILPTAPAAGEEHAAQSGPFSAPQAASFIKGLKIMPWPADYADIAQTLEKSETQKNISSFWFSHGIDEGGFDALAGILQKQGGLEIFSPAQERLPLLLRPPEKSNPDNKLEIAVTAPQNVHTRPVTVHALGEQGEIIDQQTVSLDPAKLPAPVIFDTPESARNRIAQLRIAGNTGAGGAYILDERYRIKSVGLVGPADETDPKPFVEARFYIERAVEPFTSLYEGTVEEVLKHEPSVIILPDVGALPPGTLETLEKWVKDGGLLLRFAGPAMAKEQDRQFLTPTPLRTGGRSLDGSLTWEKPQKLMPFTETSPFYGIALHEDIVVKRQVLAQPVSDLDKKTWAALEDGTPLITGAPLGKGMLVMVHTAADPSWSDVPLSGIFVELLRRIIGISGRQQSAQSTGEGTLEPVWVFDGNGTAQSPNGSVDPIPVADFATTMPNSKHPPGLYARGGYQMALNLGDRVTSLEIPGAPPAGATRHGYGKNYETSLLPYVLYAALILLLLDWLIMVVLASGMKLLRFAAFALPLLLFTPAAHAAPGPDDLKYADALYLAYMKSGDATIDAVTKHGLENLAAVLQQRTSAEPAGVVGLDPETDTLIFFPLIYWPITANRPPLSDKAITNIQNYLDHGGTILFDTRDDSAEGNVQTVNAQSLATMIGNLNVPPVMPLQKDHVLLRSFYLLEEYPGQYEDGTLWVETQSLPGRDGVSSIIIGSNDWSGAWADGGGLGGFISGATRQEELSYRFGVNLMMYALTGNYKSDQVHVTTILEDLANERERHIVR